jgi:uncharacterized membrane protein YjgN (DUF898 family)
LDRFRAGNPDMDATALAEPVAPDASTRTAMRFEGSVSEYFKIWIVNTALTIVTLGIFSAWAKVRSKRYLYGNTFIGANAFDYHASPLRILVGRAIAGGLLIGYSLTAVISPKAIFAWYLLFIFVFPWLIKSSLRFTARNTSYRNVRFDFRGTYGGAFKAFVLWPALAVVTLLVALPFSHRARDYYNINNHSFGPARFNADISVGRLFLIYLMGAGIFIASALAAIIVGTIVEIGIKVAGANLYVPALPIGIGVYVVAILIVPSVIGAFTFNLALNSTQLGDDFRFESRLSPIRMTWILFSNLAATLATLGLLYPWARIRAARYRASCITIIGPADIADFSSAPLSGGSAVGEEIASFFDIDFGL